MSDGKSPRKRRVKRKSAGPRMTTEELRARRVVHPETGRKPGTRPGPVEEEESGCAGHGRARLGMDFKEGGRYER